MTLRPRVHGERDIARTARRLAAALDRHNAAADRERAAASDALRRLESMRDGLSQRFGGLVIPANPYLMDVLGLIDVEATSRQPREWVWHWKGNWNRQNVAILRARGPGVNTDATAARWLAVAFGLIRPDDPRQLHRRGSGRPVDDVNPWQRYIGSEKLIDYLASPQDRGRT